MGAEQRRSAESCVGRSVGRADATPAAEVWAGERASEQRNCNMMREKELETL